VTEKVSTTRVCGSVPTEAEDMEEKRRSADEKSDKGEYIFSTGYHGDFALG
jgi:hypothetical protein